MVTRPMKGTAPRGRWLEEDENQAAALAASAKDRAENVMIVDLLRNDLGRIARPGSVEATRLFDIERYETVWQMTSTIRARTAAGPVEVLKALFPCGSITGAPKIRTMEIIAELETAPRGIYTGALGWFGPGRRASFSVPIRTVQVEWSTGEAVYGVGGGVTWGSTAEGEFEECLVKARLLRQARPDFDLLETLRWEPGSGYFLLERHLARLLDSSRYFGRPLNVATMREALLGASAGFGEQPQRVRLLVGHDGAARIECRSLPPEATFSGNPSSECPIQLALAADPIDSRDPFLCNKTSHREVYERARRARPGADDVILWNERGEATESTIANLVLDFGDGLLWTPPRECGMLGGTFRELLLEEGKIQERMIQVDELRQAKRIWLVNSVRGWMAAELVGSADR